MPKPTPQILIPDLRALPYTALDPTLGAPFRSHGIPPGSFPLFCHSEVSGGPGPKSGRVSPAQVGGSERESSPAEGSQMDHPKVLLQIPRGKGGGKSHCCPKPGREALGKDEGAEEWEHWDLPPARVVEGFLGCRMEFSHSLLCLLIPQPSGKLQVLFHLF